MGFKPTFKDPWQLTQTDEARVRICLYSTYTVDQINLMLRVLPLENIQVIKGLRHFVAYDIQDSRGIPHYGPTPLLAVKTLYDYVYRY